eukprot:3687141-Prymnesium_polylepis.1
MHSADVRRRAVRSPSTSWSGRCAARGTPVINCKEPSISARNCPRPSNLPRGAQVPFSFTARVSVSS